MPFVEVLPRPDISMLASQAQGMRVRHRARFQPFPVGLHDTPVRVMPDRIVIVGGAVFLIGHFSVFLLSGAPGIGRPRWVAEVSVDHLGVL